MNVIVKIRLKRVGTTKRPRYRVVVVDSAAKRDGRVIEEIGSYDPTQQPAVFSLNEESVIKWLKVGAQPTETVKSLITKAELYQKLAQ
ncbi:MAG TPA: 30S ribosomal protein S16 [Cyanobacteria bacterium UBA8530]|nr:30S ribosomal protein S16 [Cyanobacteria bacterium UBA8530]